MSKPYNYQKELFTRPLWSDANILLLKIWAATAIFSLLVVFYFLVIYENLPHHQLAAEIKKSYFAKIVYLERETQPPPAPEINAFPVRIPEKTDAEFVEKLFENDRKKNVADIVKEIENSNRNSDVESEIAAILNNGTEHFKVITGIIDDIPQLLKIPPSVTYSPLEPILQRRKTSRENLQMFKKRTENNVQIPPPDVTDFDVVTGYRDYEETLTLINGNRKFIKYCIEKYQLHNPTLKGNLVVKFDIHPDGHVIAETIRIVSWDIRDPRVLQCIKKHIRRWNNFPKVAYEMGNYTITQKYIF